MPVLILPTILLPRQVFLLFPAAANSLFYFLFPTSPIEKHLLYPHNNTILTIFLLLLLFLQGWELVLDAGGAVKNVIDAKKVKIHEFFADILGGNWASFLPNLFTSQSKHLGFLIICIKNGKNVVLFRLLLLLLFQKTYRLFYFYFPPLQTSLGIAWACLITNPTSKTSSLLTSSRTSRCPRTLESSTPSLILSQMPSALTPSTYF